jgi:hypothetical protein
LQLREAIGGIASSSGENFPDDLAHPPDRQAFLRRDERYRQSRRKLVEDLFAPVELGGLSEEADLARAGKLALADRVRDGDASGMWLFPIEGLSETSNSTLYVIRK